MKLNLDTAPTYFRSPVLRGAPQGVDREGRVIRGLSVITVGEALGHRMFIDEAFLAQTAAAGNAQGRGPKSRLTHPDLSSDGISKHLGRVNAFRTTGNQVRADLAIAKAASKSPDVDLAEFVIELADEDPEAFGASIVFERDHEAEALFMLEHGATVDDDGVIDTESFLSPAKGNTGNLMHARLKALIAVDVVGDPAANPNGLFSASQEVVSKASDALSYVLGLSDQAPEETAFGVHPERAKQFVERFLSNRGLKVVPQEQQMSATKNTAPETPAASTPKPATLGELKASFPDRADFVLAQLEAGATLDQAHTAFGQQRVAELEAELEESRKRNAELAVQAQATPKAATKQAAGVDPVTFTGQSDDAGGDFMALARAYRDERHPNITQFQRKTSYGMTQAIKACQEKHPTVYRAWKARQAGLRTKHA